MANRKQSDSNDVLVQYLEYLKLSFALEHCRELARLATEEHWDHLTFLTRVLEGEVLRRQNRSVERRIRLARFPVTKTLEQFDWSRLILRGQLQSNCSCSFFRLNTTKSNA